MSIEKTGYTISWIDEANATVRGYEADQPAGYVLERDGEWKLDLGTDLAQAKLDAEGHLTDATWEAEWTVEDKGLTTEIWTLTRHFEDAAE